MTLLFKSLTAGALALGAITVAAPAQAQIDNRDPGRFVQSLATTGFNSLKGDRARGRQQFRALLGQHFAVDAIGDRLIQRWRPQIKPAQYQAYKAAFPGFIIGTYADRLFEYSDASLKVVRVMNQGNNAAVLSQVTRPGQRPVQALWSVSKIGGAWKVTNLTVNGINLTVAQRADFDAYVQRNGFDALVGFMKKRG